MENHVLWSMKKKILEKKEESYNKETQSVASKRKENVIELKETRTPKKIKSSPAKKEVDIFKKGIIGGWGGCMLIWFVFKFCL